MTGARDDLQARASDTLVQTPRMDRRNSDVLISDKNQRRHPNPVDLVVYPLAGDDASSSPCHPKAMISTHTTSPLAALPSASRVGEKGPSEHDRHYPIDHQAQSKPAGNKRELPVLCNILARLWISGSLQQDQRPQKLGVPGGETQANKASHRKAEKVTGRTAELFDERYCILVEGLHVVAIACHLALTLAAEVEGQAAVTLLEQRDLGIEHATTPQQAMRKDDGFRPCAMLLIIERRPIHTDDRHADYSFTHKQPPPRRAIIVQPQIKENPGKSIASASRGTCDPTCRSIRQ